MMDIDCILSVLLEYELT